MSYCQEEVELTHLNLGSWLPRAYALNHCTEHCGRLLGPVLHQLRAAVLILCLAGASSQRLLGDRHERCGVTFQLGGCPQPYGGTHSSVV